MTQGAICVCGHKSCTDAGESATLGRATETNWFSNSCTAADHDGATKLVPAISVQPQIATGNKTGY